MRILLPRGVTRCWSIFLSWNLELFLLCIYMVMIWQKKGGEPKAKSHMAKNGFSNIKLQVMILSGE